MSFWLMGPKELVLGEGSVGRWAWILILVQTLQSVGSRQSVVQGQSTYVCDYMLNSLFVYGKLKSCWQ
jgi:hypothetical protein